MEWTVTHERIPEIVVEGKRLGRHRHHDSRSLAYPYQVPEGMVIQSVTHARNAPIYDQGAIGSCTGNAMTGALATDPVFEALPAGHPALDEAEAVAIYSAAEVIDGDGPFPPQDNGSCGLSVAKAARNAGLISGFTHCFDRATMLAALQAGPVIVGMNWYDSMDTPDADGLVAIPAGAQVRGGHEVLCREIDVTAELVWFDNSWGESWGLGGRFSMSFATLDRLLSEQGDATVPLPLSVPAPTPVPVPPGPVPVPVPPGPFTPDAADKALALVGNHWARHFHTVIEGNEGMVNAYKRWAHLKGL